MMVHRVEFLSQKESFGNKKASGEIVIEGLGEEKWHERIRSRENWIGRPGGEKMW